MIGLLAGTPLLLNAWDGTRSDWNGFVRHSFRKNGRACVVVEPRYPQPSKPWIWRARFWGHEPQVDIALLEKGYHVVYCDVSSLYGNAEAVGIWNEFYRFLIEEHGFARKAVLEGMSRGGLIMFNWAARNPDKVGCIYADAPVCDLRSWPGGKGSGTGAAECWAEYKQVYGHTEEQALAYDGQPVDRLEPLAQACVPVLIVYGDQDQVVPPSENCEILAARYRRYGGSVEMIRKPGVAHHPHSLKSPEPIVDFVIDHTPGYRTTLHGHDYYDLKGRLDNCRIRFEQSKQGRVAFLGGSITQNPGWRDKVMAYLRRRFPETQFDFISAGIASTGSTPGAFRMTTDVFAHGPVDLLFEEAAVNDATNHPDRPTEWLRGMEGIVRHARLLNPNLDIVLMEFVDPVKMTDYRAGRTPAVIAVHEKVADHYDVPFIDLAKEVTERIDAGEFTWEGDFRNLHPSPFGQELYYQTIRRMLTAAWRDPLPTDLALRPNPIPQQPLDRFSYSAGHYESIQTAESLDRFDLKSAWKNTVGGGTRKGFVDVPMLVGEEPGAAFRFSFHGVGVGIFVAAGPDAGVIEYRVDDGEWRTQDLFTRWSAGLHIPWLYVLEAELPARAHVLSVRLASQRNTKSRGHACRIVHFAVNGSSN